MKVKTHIKNPDIQLIETIKTLCDKNISFIEEVASVLEINYDAAYRRINHKTKISLDDALKLSKYYNVSLAELYGFDEQEKFIVNKTKEINNALDLENYFKRLIKNLAILKEDKNASITYCAKDLPIYYFLSNNLLSRFKIYVWLYILNNDERKKHIPFEKFNIPLSLATAAQNAGKAYDNTQTTEVWNYGIINSTINQISFFFETKLLNYDNVVQICSDLYKTIDTIEENIHLGKRRGFNKEFKLYHNELLLLNNNTLLKYKNKKALISPYSLLKYYFIEDQETCNKFETFIDTQISFSKRISNLGIKETMLFFKPKRDKIDKLKERIELIRKFPRR